MAELRGLEPLGLEEYDTPEVADSAQRQPDQTENGPDPLTQMEENLGVEDLGVDDVLQTKVRKPLPKLDAKRLLNPHRGYPFLLEHLKKIPYRGKGDEKRYLKKYVNTYLIWANRLWPKANFDDFTVLARKAGRDPQVRQYCRDLIEEEKYGGGPPDTLSIINSAQNNSHQTADTPRRNNESYASRSVSPSSAWRDTDATSPSPEWRNSEAQSPPSEWRSNEGHSPSSERRNTEAASPPSEWGTTEAASPPSEWRSGTHNENRHENEGQQSAKSLRDNSLSEPAVQDEVGPNEDEEAAALELYGDLDL